MKRSKWIGSVRERLVDLYIECDSTDAKDAEMSTFERRQLQKKIKEIVGYIDTRLPKCKV